MTEREWLASEDPAAMLGWLRVMPGLAVGTPSDRKWRLFAAACCRAVGWSGEVIDAGERWAETGVPPDELPPNIKLGGQTWLYYPGAADAAREWATCSSVPTQATRAAILRDIVGSPYKPIDRSDMRCDGCGRTSGWVGGFVNGVDVGKGPRCPDCRTIPRLVMLPVLDGQVQSLAQAAYEHRQGDGTLDPFRLALLADALEEAGCPATLPCRLCKGEKIVVVPGTYYKPMKCPCAEIEPHPLLAHLRSPGPHYRGCWAVDLTIGKE